jgi:DNA repair exonuclease SbcCD nuclease subunit
MRIQICSDLHLEFLQNRFPGERLIKPAPHADVLVLAGDISHSADAIALFGNWPVPVIYICGNHEFYHCELESTYAAIGQKAYGTSIRFLNNSQVDIDGVRFLGSTLWTDYRLERNRSQRTLMWNAELRIRDHQLIRCQSGEFSARRALAEHEESRTWLASQLATPHGGKTVVVTHHACHPLSIHRRYYGDPTNAAFGSNLSDLLPPTDLWIHGHVHDSFDYSVLGCRVVANPLGYPTNLQAAARVQDITFENAAFQWGYVVDLNAL